MFPRFRFFLFYPHKVLQEIIVKQGKKKYQSFVSLYAVAIFLSFSHFDDKFFILLYFLWAHSTMTLNGFYSKFQGSFGPA